MVSLIAGFLGGLGLFFAGLKLTGEGVRRLAGRRFRARFLRWTKNRPLAGLTGFFLGVFFQSTSGLSLLLASLVGAGATSVANALPVLVGANAGVASLVVMAVVDIRVLIFGLVGFSGLILAFERPSRLVPVAQAMFGVGLLLLGLHVVREAAAPLAQVPWFQAMLTLPDLTLPIFCLVGALACFLLQTAAGVSILTITMASAGLLAGDSALAIIYGSLMGSSLLARFYAIQLTGARKRLVMGQVFFNVFGLCLFLPLFFIEQFTGLPLLFGPASWLFDSLAAQLTALRIFFDVFTALALLAVMPLYLRFLERLVPDSPDERDESLVHMREISDLSPETALLVVSAEQGRLVARLAVYVDRLRQALAEGRPLKVASLRDALDAQLKEMEEGLHDIAEAVDSERPAECVALVQSAQDLICAANEALREVVENVAALRDSPSMARLGLAVMEGTDLLLLTAADAFSRDGDDDALDQLLELCHDRGPTMQQLRSRYFSEELAASAEQRWGILRLTSAFERLVWILRRLAKARRRILKALGEADPSPTPPRNMRENAQPDAP